MPRWKKQSFAKDAPVTLFSHDVMQTMSKKVALHATCIVTEGWLGHIITGKTKEVDIEKYSVEIEKLYKAWLSDMYLFYPHMVIVCTIPYHVKGANKHIPAIITHAEKRGMTSKVVPQVYTRTGQNVGRKIVTFIW
jgi:hypothetical protein